MDLTRCLSIFFWTSACQQAGSRNFAFVGAVGISSLRLRLSSQEFIYRHETREISKIKTGKHINDAATTVSIKSQKTQDKTEPSLHVRQHDLKFA